MDERKKRQDPVPPAEMWAVWPDCCPSRGTGNQGPGGFNWKEHLYTVSTSHPVTGAAGHVTKDRTFPALWELGGPFSVPQGPSGPLAVRCLH